MLASEEEESWQRAPAPACKAFRLAGKTEMWEACMPLFGISVSVGILLFFYNIERLFVNIKTLRTLTFNVEKRVF